MLSIYSLMLGMYLFILFIDFSMWRSFSTPLFLSAFPIIFLLILNKVYAHDLGFYTIDNLQFYISLLLAFASILIASLFVYIIGKNVHHDSKAVYSKVYNWKQIKHAKQFISFAIVLKTIQVILLYLSGVSFFQMKEYLGSGLSGLTNELMILSIVLIYGTTIKLNFKYYILLLLAFIPLFLYGTRGWMLISIIAAIMFRGYYLRIWPNKILIISAPILGILFMMFTYIFKNTAGDVEASYSEIFTHVMGYFVAGIQGGNQLIGSMYDKQPYFEMSFSGLINLSKFILGNNNYVSNVGPNYFDTNYITPSVTNVSTAFGTLFHGLGKYFASLYIFIIFLFLYILFLFKNKIKNIFFLIYYCVIVAGVALSFFEYYLGLLFYFTSILQLFFIYLYTLIASNASKKFNKV